MMTEPMRVLHVVGSLGIGGIQSYVMELYRHIDRDEVQFDFVVNIKTEQSYADEIKELGGKVFYIDGDAFEKKQWKQYIHFWKQFYKDHPEYRIVHGHLRSTAIIYLREAKKAGLYTIAHSHATSNGYGKSAFVKDLLQWPVRNIADYCMGCSQQANEWMFGKKRANGNTCCVIKNGIDAKRFSYDPAVRKKIRTQLGFADTDIFIGTVGRLVEQKNQELVISAFAEALKVRDNLRLVIVGDGPLYNRLKQLAENLEISQYTTFTGARSDVNELLQAFDIFVLSSKDEGLGIAIIEAQAAALPVIISPAITDEACVTENVMRVDSYDKNQWTQAFVSTEARQRTGREIDIAEAGYDIQASSNWLQEFYKKVVSVGDSK